MSGDTPSPTTKFEPAPALWASLLRQTELDAQSRATRSQLGLPTDGPIVMTGHQAEIWHAGILAKYIAAHSLAHTAGAHAAHLVVDTDETDPGAVRVPVADADGRLASKTVRLLPQPPAGVPSCALPASPPAPADTSAPLQSIVRGVSSITEALRRHASGANLGAQTGLALGDLMRPWAPLPPPIFASALARTESFAALVRRMADDAPACIAAHNTAAALVPEARLAPLATGPRPELPLWRLRPGRARVRVYADDIANIPPSELAPRALLLTGFLRLYACDLFIHGAGGAVYDRITERWLGEWLGLTLAPTTMATATLVLPLRAEAPTLDAIDRAAWTAHHARHDPSLIGDDAAAERKSSLVALIRTSREQGADPLPHYRELQSLLGETRAKHVGALAELDSRAAALRAQREQASVASDRTWAFPLHEAAALDALAAHIQGALR